MNMKRTIKMTLMALALLVCGAASAQTDLEYTVTGNGFRTTYVLNQYSLYTQWVATLQKVEPLEGETSTSYTMPSSGTVSYDNHN